MTIRALNHCVHPVEGDLADRHASPEDDGPDVHVGHFQGDVTLEPWVNKPSRGVDDQAKSAQRTLALDPGCYFRAKPDTLQGPSQDELTGVEDELLRDEGLPLEVVWIFRVYWDSARTVLDEVAPKVKVNTGWLNHESVIRGDINVPRLYLRTYLVICQQLSHLSVDNGSVP